MADVSVPIPYSSLSKKEKQKLRQENQERFKATVGSFTEKAEEIVNNVLPQKILDIDNLYKKFGEIDVALTDVASSVTLPEIGSSGYVDLGSDGRSNGGEMKMNDKEESTEKPQKKRKLSKTKATSSSSSSSSSTATTPQMSSASKKIWGKKGFTSPEQIEHYMSHVPVNQAISKVLNPLKKETLALVEVIGTLKIWIQLNIPRIEDGNNFGVGVQEEILSEVGRIEDAAFSIIEQMTKYFVARGKLVSKVLKWTGVEDYRESVRELDEKQYIQLRLSCLDLRNHYYLLYDMITKNIEKLRKPRSSHSVHMF